MKQSNQPVIVVVAFDRPKALKRLLGSLSTIRTDRSPELLISIDNAGEASNEVEAIARSFEWPWEMSVVRLKENLGLKAHVMQCAGLSQKFGSVIILEDDLLVAPAFYDRAVELLDRYEDEPSVAGISLYTYGYCESNGLPFQPIKGNGDVHLMHQVSSWGQAWTAKQWSGFTQWTENQPPDRLNPNLPPNVSSWPISSWKKHFIDYVVSNEMFIVFPFTSLTSNCGDRGTHFSRKYDLFRTSLDMGLTPLNLPPLNKVTIRYDIYHELLPSVIKQHNPDLEPFEFDVDINGSKPLNILRSPYTITSRSCSRFERSFGDELKPLELNVLQNIEGNRIRLVRREDLHEDPDAKLEWYRTADQTPRWVHDALGTPMKERIATWSSQATRSTLANRVLSTMVRTFLRPRR